MSREVSAGDSSETALRGEAVEKESSLSFLFCKQCLKSSGGQN